MNSGVTTSLREARVTREHSHPLLDEKRSKKDVSVDICQSAANIPMSILSVIVYSLVVVVQSLREKPHPGAAAREPPRDSPVIAEMRAFVSCMA